MPPLDDVERAAEPTDISVDIADKEVPRYGGKKSCAKWCHFIPAIKWIPECKDCGDTGLNDAASSSAILGKIKRSMWMKNCQKNINPLSSSTKTQQQRQRHKQEKKRDGSSSWLIDVMLRPFRRSRHQEDRSLRAAPTPAPACAAWCKMVSDKKVKRWIPECLGCDVAAAEVAEGEDSLPTANQPTRPAHLQLPVRHDRATTASAEDKKKKPCMKW